MKINQSGRSMIEMLGVLAIIGVLSVGGIAGYSKAMNKYRINKITDQVSMIAANIRTLYAMQRDYTGLDTNAAANTGAIPDEMITSTVDGTTTNATLANPYNGSVFVHSAALNGETANPKAFMIIYNGLPREACVSIASNDWGEPVAIRAASSAIGAETFDDATNMKIGCAGTAAAAAGTVACPNGGTTAVPMPVATASTACACTTNACSIAWKYY